MINLLTEQNQNDIIVVIKSEKVNPFKPGFIILIFIHYKPVILDLLVEEDDMKSVTNEKKYIVTGYYG